VTRYGGVAILARGEVALERGKGGENANLTDANLTGPKNTENTHHRFNYYKWMMKI
jgi:hypothetical protein